MDQVPEKCAFHNVGSKPVLLTCVDFARESVGLTGYCAGEHCWLSEPY